MNKWLHLGHGWYDLEHDDAGPFRWNSGNALLILPHKNIIKYIEFTIRNNNNINNIIHFTTNDNLHQSYTIYKGVNTFCVKVGKDTTKILIQNPVFIPSKVEPGSTDSRELGYQFLDFNLIADLTVNYSIKDIMVENTYNKITDEYVNDKSITVKRIDDYGSLIIDVCNNTPTGKFDLSNQLTYYSHRSGWHYAIKSMEKFNNPTGIQFEGYLEMPFYFSYNEYKSQNKIPFTRPWVGVLHNPYTMPQWFLPNSDPESIFNVPEFRESLSLCKGIYTLSKTNAEYIKNKFPALTVDWLYHPTEIPYIIFDLNKFITNKTKKVINIGWWLRKYTSIFKLKVDPRTYEKYRLLPINTTSKHIKEGMERIREYEQTQLKIDLTLLEINSVEDLSYKTNTEYDILLSNNIVFIDLYDSCANNVIIECMARYTPILINKLPSVVEYLGEDYPFYFSTLEEASDKLHDLPLIQQTHLYLKQLMLNKPIIKAETFIQQIENSSIYKNL